MGRRLTPPALEPFLVTVQVEDEFWVGDMVHVDRGSGKPGPSPRPLIADGGGLDGDIFR